MKVGIDDASVLWFAHDTVNSAFRADFFFTFVYSIRFVRQSLYIGGDDPVRLVSLGHAVRHEHLATMHYRLVVR